MQKWEYKLITMWLSEQELNALGGEGWEMVEVIITHTDKTFAYVFKRPKL